MSSASDLESRLRAAVDSVVPSVDEARVLAEVQRRRSTRRRHRTVRRAAGATALAAAACVLAATLSVTDRPTDVHSVDAADATSTPASPVPGPDTGAEATEVVPVPGSGDRVTPLAAATDGFWVARGAADVTTGGGGDLVSKLDLDGRVVARTELRGQALAATLDRGALWVLVAEPETGGVRSLRLKEIDPADGRLRASHVVPSAGSPTAVVASGSGLTVVFADVALELGHDGRGRAAEPPEHLVRGADEVVTSGSLTWVRRGRSVTVVGDSQGPTVEVPGIRRITAAPASGNDGVLAEVLRGSSVDVVELRRDGSNVRERGLVGNLTVRDAVVAHGFDGIWVVRGTEVRQVAFDRD